MPQSSQLLTPMKTSRWGKCSRGSNPFVGIHCLFMRLDLVCLPDTVAMPRIAQSRRRVRFYNHFWRRCKLNTEKDPSFLFVVFVLPSPIGWILKYWLSDIFWEGLLAFGAGVHRWGHTGAYWKRSTLRTFFSSPYFCSFSYLLYFVLFRYFAMHLPLRNCQRKLRTT